MANNKNAISAKCSVCDRKFRDIQECLRHELINHSLKRTLKKKKNTVEKVILSTVKFLNEDEKLMERERLKQKLNKCKSGQELRTIFDLFCIKTDNLDLIFTRIQTCLEKELSSAGIVKIYPFGSIASGLALRDCDIDIYLDVFNMHLSPARKSKSINVDFHQRKSFNRITKLLKQSQHFIEVFPIRAARVPIIKCKHKDTGFSIDINVSYPSSRENTQFIYNLLRSDERIHELMLFLKLWAKNSQIISRITMTSYCLITMVIFFLQQPRKSETQTNNNNGNVILKSIKELQKNCYFHMVQGVNYAYDLNSEENKPNIPYTVTTWDLIKEFFDFYHNFNFEDHVISPYYGKFVLKTNMTPTICEDYYKQLRTITQYLQGQPANNLQIDRCMCVQDAFCLNQNTAKNITPQNKQYILLCLKNAKRICENPENLKLTELYQKLLFETINIHANEAKEMENDVATMDTNDLKLPKIDDANNTNNNESNLIFSITPSKADVRTIFSYYPHLKSGDEILRCWCLHYIDGVEAILTNLYRMDMQKQQPAQQKQQKLDNEGADKNLNQEWSISCTIDLWSNRCFQRNLKISFMNYQLQQTERLHNLRRQDPKFSVSLNGVLKLNILPNYTGINMQLELNEGNSGVILNKKHPLRKFFNVFKSTLQNFSFKEVLNIDYTQDKNNKNTEGEQSCKTEEILNIDNIKVEHNKETDTERVTVIVDDQ